MAIDETDPRQVDDDLLQKAHNVRAAKSESARAKARVHLSRRLYSMGDNERGWQEIETASKEMPDDPLVQRGFGLALFRHGKIAKGLDVYDKGRWQLPSFEKFKRPYPFPHWNGEDLRGKKILVWAEQGVGDQIMHARVLHDLLKTGVEISVECEPRLIPLFKRTYPEVTFVTQTVPLVEKFEAEKFDFQTSMFSAWRWVKRPGDFRPPMTVDAKKVADFKKAWRRREGGVRKNIGIAWSSKASATGARRTIPLDMLEPLGVMAGDAARFHNLQYGESSEKSMHKRFGQPIWHDANIDPLSYLEDTAAQIAALDLVITIDNATAHMAAALDVPTWILLPKGAEFRWGLEAETTRLYPKARLFRSPDVGRWGRTLLGVSEALNEYLGHPKPIIKKGSTQANTKVKVGNSGTVKISF